MSTNWLHELLCICNDGSNLMFTSAHADLAYPWVALPQVVSLKPVCRMDFFPVDTGVVESPRKGHRLAFASVCHGYSQCPGGD
jgi:hypothetical protein